MSLRYCFPYHMVLLLKWLLHTVHQGNLLTYPRVFLQPCQLYYNLYYLSLAMHLEVWKTISLNQLN